jgi:prophage regulatory protein
MMMSTVKEVPPAYLRPGQLAQHLGVSEAAIWLWAKQKPQFPKPVRLGRRCTVWRVADVEKFMVAHQG